MFVCLFQLTVLQNNIIFEVFDIFLANRYNLGYFPIINHSKLIIPIHLLIIMNKY